MRVRSSGAPSSLVAVFAGGLLAVAVLAGGAAGSPPGAAALRKQEVRAEVRHRAAVLSLLSLETQLTRARDHLADRPLALVGLEARGGIRAPPARDRTACASSLPAASSASGFARCTWPEDVDPIAAILGSSSLDEMMTGLDGIASAAEQNRSVIVQTRSARSKLARHAACARRGKGRARPPRSRPRRGPPTRSSRTAPSALLMYARSRRSRALPQSQDRRARPQRGARGQTRRLRRCTPGGLAPPGAGPQSGADDDRRGNRLVAARLHGERPPRRLRDRRPSTRP